MNLVKEKIRKLRIEKGLQQKEMAAALKISIPAYSKIENGNTQITIDLLQKIADVFSIYISELIDGKPTNIQIKNGNNSPLAIEHSTLILQNEQLINNQNRIMEQMISLMINQNEIFKEFVKLQKSKM